MAVVCLMSSTASILGAIGFLGFARVDDFNDYPGYTCSLRDGHVPSAFTPEPKRRHSDDVRGGEVGS